MHVMMCRPHALHEQRMSVEPELEPLRSRGLANSAEGADRLTTADSGASEFFRIAHVAGGAAY